MVERIARHDPLPLSENISRTLPPAAEPVTPESASSPERCVYVAADAWHYGAPLPFCDAPARRGSAYCAAHHALCAVPAASRAGRRILAAQRAAAAQALLQHHAPAVPEPVEREAADALAALEVLQPRPRREKGEGDEEGRA